MLLTKAFCFAGNLRTGAWHSSKQLEHLRRHVPTAAEELAQHSQVERGCLLSYGFIFMPAEIHVLIVFYLFLHQLVFASLHQKGASMTLEVLEPSVIKRFDGLMRSVAPGSLTKIGGSAREASEAEYGQARLREAGKRRTQEANSSWNALIQVLASPPDVLVPEECASSHFFLHPFPNFSRSLTAF